MAIGSAVAMLALVAGLTGCAGGLNETSVGCPPLSGDPSFTPTRVVSNPDLLGERVTWGGTFVLARHGVDTTELEIVAFPLDACGRPLRQRAPLGRFVLVYPGFLETADLRAGRGVTATGELIGLREGSVGETRYRYPLVEDASPRIWPEISREPVVRRPVFSIGIGAGSGWSGGGVGVSF